MAVSDDKQQRLSTLSQDVIAVPKKPAAAAPSARPAERPDERAVEAKRKADVLREPEPAYTQPPVERRPIPPTQDVFRVTPTVEVPIVASSSTWQPPPSPAPAPPPVSAPRAKLRASPAPAASAITSVQMATGGVALLALLIAVYGVFGGGAADTSADVASVAKLTEQLNVANDRVGKLEMALSAAAADTPKPGSPAQVNVLQISAGMRQLRNDIDVLANDMERVSAEIGELRALAGSSSGQAKLAASQVEQLASRVATLNEQVANAPRTASAPPAASGAGNAEVQAQLKALSARTEKMANDIRQLYRLVGGQ